MKTKIKAINAIRKDEVIVSLYGMRADLTDCMIIVPSEITEWFGVDNNGYSVEYEIKPGVEIEFDSISFRKLINPRFV